MCSLCENSHIRVKPTPYGERERDRQTERERETDRQRGTYKQTFITKTIIPTNHHGSSMIPRISMIIPGSMLFICHCQSVYDWRLSMFTFINVYSVYYIKGMRGRFTIIPLL